MALVIDYCSHELIEWLLCRNGWSKAADSASEQVLIARSALLMSSTSFLLRSDNGLIFTSRSYTTLVPSCELSQEFTTAHIHEQNGMVE